MKLSGLCSIKWEILSVAEFADWRIDSENTNGGGATVGK